MEQHPVPRQITSFEFKLVGFLTIKQFIYIVVFIGLGGVMYLLFPVPIINVLLAILVGLIGLAFAFLPVNDRPLDVWVRNLIKRLTSPTQYFFKKNNPPPAFLLNLPSSSPTQLNTHIDSQKKLSNYIGKTSISNQKKQSINNLFQRPNNESVKTNNNQQTSETQKSSNTNIGHTISKKPFISGIVKDHDGKALYGILIYVKKGEGEQPLRIFKTNVNGVFASFNKLEPEQYYFEIKDPQGNHNFDTMKIKLETINEKPFEFISKELI